MRGSINRLKKFCNEHVIITLLLFSFTITLLLFVLLFQGRIKDKFKYNIDFGESRYERLKIKGEIEEEYLLEQLKESYGRDFVIENYRTAFSASEWNPLGFLSELLLVVDGYSIEENVEMTASFGKKFELYGSNFVNNMFEHKKDRSFIRKVIENVYGEDSVNISIELVNLYYSYRADEKTKEKEKEMIDSVVNGTFEEILKFNKEQFSFLSMFIYMYVYYDSEGEFEQKKEEEREKIYTLVKAIEEQNIKIN